MAVVTKNTPEFSSPAAQPRRRWYQFTLRTAGVWMALLCLLLGSFAWWRDRAERQRKVVEELRGLGATVDFRYFSLTKRHTVDDPVSPEDEFFMNSWACRCFGDDFVYAVDSVSLAYFNGGDTFPPEKMRLALPLLPKCPHLTDLSLDGDTATGTDLKQIPYLESLKALSVIADSYNPQGLTDSDVSSYCGIRAAYLHSRGLLTDDDLVLLESATCLEYLNLENQPIGDKGVMHLRNCRRLQTLMLRDTCVTDAALDHLHNLPELSYLSLLHTRVTAVGRKRFQDLHPNCLVEVD